MGAVAVYLLMNRKVTGMHIELVRKDTELTMLNQQHSEEVKMREQQFNEQLKTTKEQLHVMAQQLMDAQAKRLKEENTESMGHITQPLKDAISEMRKAINDNTKDHTAQTASLREQLRLMMESNREIGEKAESLTNVLRRDNKVSGNMGEIILGDLLTSQGLTEGIHYEVQARLRDDQGRPLKNDDTGKEMQPDVILHYPQGQDVIIDSKVSLVAYERYVNAEQPEEKERALQEHIKSVRQHVTELSRKDYSKYIKAPRESVDFVIMGEQNLLGILHMIHIAWVQNQQAENQEKVFGIAEQLLDRLGDFVQRYNKVGEQIEQARKAFEFSTNKLSEGRQSVAQKANELISLGAKENPNRRIPKADNGLPE